MGWKELIPNIEDRQFQTGTGHWDGDQGWSGETYYSKTAFMKMTINDPSEEKITTLSYPHVTVRRGVLNEFRFQISGLDTETGHLYADFLITDGVYSFGVNEIDAIDGEWSGDIFFDDVVPEDWILENTQIRIRLYVQDDSIGTMLFDDFSLTYESVAKIQYLPIMGVG